MAMVQTKSWKENAIKAYEFREADNRADHLKRAGEAINKVLANVGLSGEAVIAEDGHVEVVVDGVAFSTADYGRLAVTKRCPECKGRIYSWGIDSLADLGAVLSGQHFQHHFCPFGAKGPGEELLAALENFMASRTGEGA